jgi:hypothetical protein
MGRTLTTLLKGVNMIYYFFFIYFKFAVFAVVCYRSERIGKGKCMSAKKETAQRSTTITLSMPTWMRDEVKRQAKASNRSNSDYVKLILLEKLANVSIIGPQSDEHPRVCPASGCGAKNVNTCKSA